MVCHSDRNGTSSVSTGHGGTKLVTLSWPFRNCDRAPGQGTEGEVLSLQGEKTSGGQQSPRYPKAPIAVISLA